MKGNASIIFDAREYYPRQKEDSLIFRLFEKPERIRLCKAYLHLCDRVLTVSPGLAEEYKREFNITTELIRSVPMYFDCKPAKVKTKKIRMVHHVFIMFIRHKIPAYNFINQLNIIVCILLRQR